LTQTPATYFIDVLEDTEILQISKENLDRLYERVPKFERLFRLISQNAFIAQQERINQNLSYTAEQKYADFIKHTPNWSNGLHKNKLPHILVSRLFF
jgi:CRP-like cAMP-binding protein